MEQPQLSTSHQAEEDWGQHSTMYSVPVISTRNPCRHFTIYLPRYPISDLISVAVVWIVIVNSDPALEVFERTVTQCVQYSVLLRNTFIPYVIRTARSVSFERRSDHGSAPSSPRTAEQPPHLLVQWILGMRPSSSHSD